MLIFLAFAASRGHAPLDRRLYLTEDRATDPERRETCHVRETVVFQEKWRIALDLLDQCRGDVPHGWIAGDDEFNRGAEFRAALRKRRERYVLDVPCNTLIRELEARRPPRRKAGVGRKREVPFIRVDAWAARRPAEQWTRMTIRYAALVERNLSRLIPFRPYIDRFHERLYCPSWTSWGKQIS